LTEEVIKQHAEIHNIAQGAAEEFYISQCQQLDGYGQETFTAKDDSGNEVMLGISVSGIIVACTDSHKFYPCVLKWCSVFPETSISNMFFFSWRDISNVVNHKRTFNIECTTPENSVGFTLTDAETGRYVWKLCVLQHTFFMKYEQNQTHPISSQMNLFSNIPDNLNDSRDDLLADQQLQQQQQQMLSNWQASTETQISNTTTNSNSQNNNNWSTPESTPVTASTMSMAASNNMLMQSRNSLQASALDVNQLTSMNPWGGLNGVNSGSNASLINRAQSSSCLDLSNNNNNTSSTNINQDRERLKALLPTYRPAPDYETAVQQKYHTSSHELRFNANPLQQQPQQLFQQQIYNPTISGSQPDVHSANTKMMQMYPDVTHHTTGHLLTSDLTQQFKMMKFVKPAPPPYAANRLSSTSTPDLALASHRALLGYPPHVVSGSSPDLVSSRTFVSHHPQHQQQQHQIYHHHPHMAPQNHQIFYAASANGGGGTRLRHSHSFLPHGKF
jgi:tyrosine-protein phosphatase non-receptor type 14/21